MTNEEILSCFWLPNECYRTAISGADANTIIRYDTNLPCSIDSDAVFNHRINRIIAEANKQKGQIKSNGRYMKNGQNLPDGYTEIVNDALESIYLGGGGVAFNDAQAATICSFLKCPNIKFKDWYIYITEKR